MATPGQASARRESPSSRDTNAGVRGVCTDSSQTRPTQQTRLAHQGASSREGGTLPRIQAESTRVKCGFLSSRGAEPPEGVNQRGCWQGLVTLPVRIPMPLGVPVMLLDPRPGSLTGSSHVTSPSFVCSSGANVLAEKGLAGASTRDRNTPKPCPPCAPRGNHLWSFPVRHAEPKPLLRGSAMPRSTVPKPSRRNTHSYSHRTIPGKGGRSGAPIPRTTPGAPPRSRTASVC
jgi:hypothetical protein